MFPMLPMNPRRHSDSGSDSDRLPLVSPGDPQVIPDIDLPGAVNLNFDGDANLGPESAQASGGCRTFDIVDEDADQSRFSSYFSSTDLEGPLFDDYRVAPEEETPSCFTRFRERAGRVFSSESMTSCVTSCLSNVCNVCHAIWYLNTEQDEVLDPREERGEFINQDYDLDVRNYQLSTGKTVTYNPTAQTETGYQFDVVVEDETAL